MPPSSTGRRPGQLYQAQLKLARTTLARDEAIGAGSSGAVSRQQLDQDRAAVEEADARVKAYQASLDVYKLNVEFTRVIAPIGGQVSRYYLTLGNLVNQDQTLLTTVVSLDPIYAYFDMDEPTLLRIRRAVNEGKIKTRSSGAEIPVLMGLQGEQEFPHRGTINFVNNQVNPTTGSISVRGVFPNPAGGGVRLLSPGMFARIRLQIAPLPGPAGDRSRRRVRPGTEVRLRGRRREQSPIPAGHDGGAPGGWLARNCGWNETRRLGRRGRLAASPPPHAGATGKDGHAVLGAASTRSRKKRTGSEVRGQRSEVRGQKSGVAKERGQKTEDRSQQPKKK